MRLDYMAKSANNQEKYLALLNRYKDTPLNNIPRTNLDMYFRALKNYTGKANRAFKTQAEYDRYYELMNRVKRVNKTSGGTRKSRQKSRRKSSRRR